MTQPHPQPHCDHECVCDFYISLHMKGDECPMNGHPKNPCEHDTRTHTPAAPAEPWCYPGCMLVYKAKEQARKDEREQVLGALEEFLNSDDHLSLFKWEVREQIRSLRGGGA